MYRTVSHAYTFDQSLVAVVNELGRLYERAINDRSMASTARCAVSSSATVIHRSKLSQISHSSRRTVLLGSIILPNSSSSIQPQRANRQAAAMPSKLIDAHVHVWAPVEDARSGKYPYYGQMLGSNTAADEPPMPGHAEVLLAAMQEAGVSGAMIVQPANHMYDHSYVTSVLQAHPDKFVGCLLADPTPGGGGVTAIEQLSQEHGYRAVRFNPYLWPEGEKMTNEVGRAMYAKAGQLGLPVGHMPFKGFLLHADEIEQLLRDYPDTKAIIDHCGFCNCSDLQSPEWQRLLDLAKYPQLYIKASAFFRVSSQPYPYLDAMAGVAALVAAYGPQRIMWGSDFPWVTEKCGYVKAWQALDDSEAASGKQILTPEQRQWVFVGTIASLFPGAWS